MQYTAPMGCGQRCAARLAAADLLSRALDAFGVDMKFLAIETAASACSTAVWVDGTLSESLQTMRRGHAEALVPMVLALMRATNVRFRDLDAVAVSVGPGAFTSLRVGLAAARGIALAADLPCLGISTLEAVAASVDWAAVGSDTVVVALDTKRDDYYVQLFVKGEPLVEPAVETRSSLAERLVGFSGQALRLGGDAAESLCAALAASGIVAEVLTIVPHPTAGQIAAIAARRWLAGERPVRPPAPVYLRCAATTRPQAKEQQCRPMT